MENAITVNQKKAKERAEVVKASTPAELLTLAVSKDLDIDKLAKLMELQEAWIKEQARKSFFSALSDFQIECPDLRKTKRVFFEMKTGGTTEYFYAPLADIDRQIKKTLRDHGLTKRWEVEDKGQDITVTCIITHVDGHSEKTHMMANPDTSGSKNPIQARGSAIQYMMRYTLIGALGITTADADIDGRLPELDVDKLHHQYMNLYNQIVLMDEGFRTPGDPDNWQADRTAGLYIKAIGKARQVLAKLSKEQSHD